MHLDFLDLTLRRLATDEAFLPAGWNDEEISHVRLVAQCAQAAKVETDLHATRSLRLQACHDGEPGTSSVQLSTRRRLAIAFKNDGTPTTAVFSLLPPEAVPGEKDEPQ